MFDFQKWRAWLEEKSRQLGEQGLEVKFKVGPDDGPKPGMGLGIVGLNAMADFENWISGETDYTIMVPVSREAKMVSFRWGIIVDDETFEMTFLEFIDEFRKFETVI
jgi:hypothetical protein